MRYSAKKRVRVSVSARIFTILFVMIFMASSVLLRATSFAESLSGGLNYLPALGSLVPLSPDFEPVLLKGMTIHPENPFRFDFIVDSGNTNFSGRDVQRESERLVKYFMASMTIPENELWVNLSPYESDRVISEELGRTELGRDLLAQDYILKQLTASLMNPEEALGKRFWSRIYEMAQEQYGTTEIPLNTFNKVWILPEDVTVFEHGPTVYVTRARLKVMLDADYVAMSQTKNGVPYEQKEQEDLSISAQLVREIIIPEIEREVKRGAHFAPLRQILYSLVLAKWYKESFQNSLLSQIYGDRNMVDGITSDEIDARA